jgi:hypothetical protein
MQKISKLAVIVIAGLLLVTTACNLRSNNYSLECEIDTQQYGFKISGEDGPISVQTQGEKTQSKYDANGQIESVIVEVNRTLTFEDSGNSYTVVGSINLDPKNETVSYDITATGDTFEEPQTCQK